MKVETITHKVLKKQKKPSLSKVSTNRDRWQFSPNTAVKPIKTFVGRFQVFVPFFLARPQQKNLLREFYL